MESSRHCLNSSNRPGKLAKPFVEPWKRVKSKMILYCVYINVLINYIKIEKKTKIQFSTATLISIYLLYANLEIQQNY